MILNVLEKFAMFDPSTGFPHNHGIIENRAFKNLSWKSWKICGFLKLLLMKEKKAKSVYFVYICIKIFAWRRSIAPAISLSIIDLLLIFIIIYIIVKSCFIPRH